MGKETVLALLLREKGHFVSGEAVSAELGTPWRWYHSL